VGESVAKEVFGQLPQAVQDRVNADIVRRFGESLSYFEAFLIPDLDWGEDGAAEVLAFGSVNGEVLRRWGGKYAELAANLEQGIGRQGVGGVSDSAIEFPPLKVLDFVTARLVESVAEVEFPAIETETFTVRTIELAETATPLFSFELATVQKQGGKWVIQREPREAFGYVESLSVKKSGLISRVVGRLNPKKDLSLEMVSIPGGTFLMGSPETEPGRQNREGPQHEVTVPEFFMGRYSVTQAQWRFVAENLPQVKRKLDADPSRFKGEDLPVEQVSWEDAVEFCDRLCTHTQRQYRLPSEAEWEYACRAGTTTPFHFGETITPELANYDHKYAYNNAPKGKSPGKTTPVGQFSHANSFGLSDMHGNVWEWCLDDYSDYDGTSPIDGSARVKTSKTASKKVIRGGSWYFNPQNCRSAYRSNINARGTNLNIGFRIVYVPPRILP
jgi:formylglycine-generating enzyme required for sulfatase activity